MSKIVGKKWKMDLKVEYGRENVKMDSVNGSGICTFLLNSIHKHYALIVWPFDIAQ